MPYLSRQMTIIMNGKIAAPMPAPLTCIKWLGLGVLASQSAFRVIWSLPSSRQLRCRAKPLST